MDLPINTATLLAQIINFIIICGLLFIALLVYRDAKSRGISTTSALFWAIVSLLTLPIGLVLYIYFGRNEKTQKEQDEIKKNLS
jgi:hypothetical protein